MGSRGWITACLSGPISLLLLIAASIKATRLRKQWDAEYYTTPSSLSNTLERPRLPTADPHSNRAASATIEAAAGRSLMPTSPSQPSSARGPRSDQHLVQGAPTRGAHLGLQPKEDLARYHQLGQELGAFAAEFRDSSSADSARLMQSFLKDKLGDDDQVLPVLEQGLRVIQQLHTSQSNVRLLWSQRVNQRIAAVFNERSTAIALAFVGGYVDRRWPDCPRA
jgi:hypothetical protein